MNAGGHYNPNGGVPAAEAQSLEERDMGDIGTIEADELGIAEIDK